MVKASRARRISSFRSVSSPTSPPISVSITDRDNPEQAPSDKKGFPTYNEYKAIERSYIESICPKKRVKSVISRTDFADILRVLNDPFCTNIRDASFRFWVRRTFTLGDFQEPSGALRTNTVLHHGVPVVMQDDIYDTLCYLHGRANHGGRDKTCKEVRSHRSYLHKALVGMFVAICPTCQRRRSVCTTKKVKPSDKENHNGLDDDNDDDGDAFDDDDTLVEDTSRLLKNNHLGDSPMNITKSPQCHQDPQSSPVSLRPAADPQLILSAPWPPTDSPNDLQPLVNELLSTYSVFASNQSSRPSLPPLVLPPNRLLSSQSRSALPSPFSPFSQLSFDRIASPRDSQSLETIVSSSLSSTSSLNRMSIASILDSPLPSPNNEASPQDWNSHRPQFDLHSSKRTTATLDVESETGFPSLPVKNRVKRARRDQNPNKNVLDSRNTMMIDPVLIESSQSTLASPSRPQSRSMSPLELLATVSVDALETQSQASDGPPALVGPGCSRLMAARW